MGKKVKPLKKKIWIIPPLLLQRVNDFINLFKYDIAQDLPMMILGPTGAGKSLFIHIYEKMFREKKGKDCPVVKLNCAAFTPELILSELFGYKKGSFTGATSDHNGQIAEANNGLLVLEEIGDLPKDGQAKLLTFIEDGYYYKVGSTKPERADVYIIATTNKSEFRPDFWHRFFPFYVPGLYQRRSDILYYFHLMFPELFVQLLPHEVLALLAYNWHGNVREIERVGRLISWGIEEDKGKKTRGEENKWEKDKALLKNYFKTLGMGEDKGLLEKNLRSAAMERGYNIELYNTVYKIPQVVECLKAVGLNAEELNEKLLEYGLGLKLSENIGPTFSQIKKLPYTTEEKIEKMFSDEQTELKTCFDNQVITLAVEGLIWFLLGEPNPFAEIFMNKNLLDLDVIKKRKYFPTSLIGKALIAGNYKPNFIFDWMQKGDILKENNCDTLTPNKSQEEIKKLISSMTHKELLNFYAKAVLETNDGNKNKAAKTAGVNRNTFAGWLKNETQDEKK